MALLRVVLCRVVARAASPHVHHDLDLTSGEPAAHDRHLAVEPRCELEEHQP